MLHEGALTALRYRDEVLDSYAGVIDDEFILIDDDDD